MKCYNIPIFVPHKGCPFDCVFCNQKHITGSGDEVDEEKIKNTIEEYLKTLPKQDSYIEAAFFGGSFTGIDFDMQRRFLSTAYEYVKNGELDGIRLSTRPDYIDKKILDQLNEYGVTTIELGVQSLDNEVLKKSGRGHDENAVYDAVNLIRKYNFKLGLQMMTGLPEDTEEKALRTADKIIALKPDFVRIYPTLVVKDTYLEKMYLQGEYKPQSVDEAVCLCKKLLIKFNNAKINVIRIALQTTDEISLGGSVVAGPYNGQFRELVESQIYYDGFSSVLDGYKGNSAVIYVNTKDISKAVGSGRCNIKKIYEKYKVKVKIKGSDDLKKGDFKLTDCTEREVTDCI
ncbi:MAG: radical SAM protein [Clostridia bacterium]|nr:radical SAM protein [Clostridia bacterium]